MSAPLFNAQPHFCMENFNIQILRANAAFGKYRQMGTILTLFAFFFAGNLQAQGPCSGISFSFEHYEPCKFRARYSNTSECFIEIRYILESGSFSSWNVNTAAGFTVDVISASELWVHHDQGFVPLGDQVPLLFTLPYDLNTTMNIAYLDDCAMLGCDLFGGIPIESCPDPLNASIIGVKYRECNSLPYFNQPVLSDWTIQLLNADSNVIAEQVTDADGNYAFYDLPHGVYVVKELAQPGWSPSVPASGKYTVDLAPSQQLERNFGNCPSCSCDNIYMDVVQLPGFSDTCAYMLNVSNNDDYCFNEIDLKVAVGSFTSVTPAPGWTATMVSAQHYKLKFPPNYIPAQSFQSTFFRVTGAAQHDITVSTSWNNNGVLVTCSRPFTYQCPPPVLPPPCCPMGSMFGPELVCNPDFSLANQCFTNDYNYFNPGGSTAIGSYSVLDYGQVYAANNQWACIDHTTYTTAGTMLVVDGYNGPIAWEQQLSVTAGTTYAFSAWFNNLVKPTLSYADPQMALWVDGNQIASTAVLMENPDRWEWLCAQYTATLTGMVTLQIRMLSTASIGNDVGIDDVSFRQCIPPPSCVCLQPGAFSNMSYRPNSGPNVPISCGQIAFWQCNLPVFNLSGDFMCQGNSCPSMPPMFWTLNHPNLGQVDQGTSNGTGFLISIPNASFPVSGLYTLTIAGICGMDTCYCEIIIETPGCGGDCNCKQGTEITVSSGPASFTLLCDQHTFFPILPCPTAPVTFTSDFGCVDATGANCTGTIDWRLEYPLGNPIATGSQASSLALNLPPGLFASPGVYHFFMETVCSPSNDTCRCEIAWEVECGDCIEDFETGSLGQWQGYNGQVSIITDPITGSQVLKGNDGNNASWMYSDASAYSGDWTQKFNNCFCFNIRYDNGDPINPATGTGAINIYQGPNPPNYTNRATFVTPPIGNTWTRVCVPVGLASGTSLPSNSYGMWTNTLPNVPPNVSAFNSLITNVSGIGVLLDFGGGMSPSEMVFLDSICIEKCPSPCECKTGDLTYSSAGVNHMIPCQAGPSFPVFFCPTAPVTISGNFGCVDPNGNPCPAPPAPINWILYGPNGIIQQNTILSGPPWSLNFTAADLAGSGFFTLYMSTLCPGQVDSCICVATWFQECPPDSCVCGPNPWDNEFRFGGAQNIPVLCGQTLNVTTGSAFFPNFNCQGPANCGRVDWVLTDPNGVPIASMIGEIPNAAGGFVIPELQPTNFPDPGTYCLQMLGICGQDTCPCIVYFCLPPQPPFVNDTSICRTLTSAYIPLYDCPSDCDITQVQWFVKPCSAANFPATPYQVSSGPNCDPLLLLPYQYPGEACVQVYAVITLAPGCCVPEMITNTATINLCNPISCSITNPNPAYCQTGSPLPLTGVLSGVNCNYTVEWYNEAGQSVSTSLTYTPPVLNFPSGSTACFKDFTFTLKVIGICGTTSCSTTIRVYNANADNGDLAINPIEPLPLCPGEDVIVEYTDECSGPPPKWTWFSSINGINYSPIAGAGMINPIIYSNRLWQTTWFMVEAKNGVCPPKQEVLKVDVKDPLTIVNFTAIPDPCIENYVVLTVDFTPTPNPGGGQPGCGYTIEWYKDGNLIHTSSSPNSPVSYTYLQAGSVAGVYCAIVKDDCCNQAVKTWPIILNPSCVPAIDGPCYVCDKTTQYTLTGGMVLPPQDPCPPGVTCTYQWYQLDIATGTWVPVGTPNSLTFTTMCGGHFRFESICDYGFGPCIKNAYHDVAQCVSTGTGCMYVDAPEVILPIGMKVDIHPNPTTGSMTVQISPAALRKGRVEVVDVNGKVLASERIPENQASHTLSLAHLPNGLYFVRVFESDVLVWVGKIVRSE